ncbi:MAG TPA: hypothetical protein VK281_12740, partial [Xanthobacteraceae bacterium]|nr:hypothetical protein [Xanthobacteraceae bacterium]
MHRSLRHPTLTRTAALGPGREPVALAARLVSAAQLQPVSPALLRANVEPRCTEGLDRARYVPGCAGQSTRPPAADAAV